MEVSLPSNWFSPTHCLSILPNTHTHKNACMHTYIPSVLSLYLGDFFALVQGVVESFHQPHCFCGLAMVGECPRAGGPGLWLPAQARQHSSHPAEKLELQLLLLASEDGFVFSSLLCFPGVAFELLSTRLEFRWHEHHLSQTARFLVVELVQWSPHLCKKENRDCMCILYMCMDLLFVFSFSDPN